MLENVIYIEFLVYPIAIEFLRNLDNFFLLIIVLSLMFYKLSKIILILI